MSEPPHTPNKPASTKGDYDPRFESILRLTARKINDLPPDLRLKRILEMLRCCYDAYAKEQDEKRRQGNDYIK